MKPEEAIRKIKESYPPNIVSISYLEMLDALNLAIQALEKQITKKPHITEWPTVTTHHCTICSSPLRDEFRDEYCPECGQKIDWSEEE